MTTTRNPTCLRTSLLDRPRLFRLAPVGNSDNAFGEALELDGEVGGRQAAVLP